MENEYGTEENVARFDASQLDTKFEITPEGYLQGVATVTRCGVFPYVVKDGTIRYELRRPDEVFRADSLATLLMKPMTNEHPAKGLINVDDVKQYSIGMVGSNAIRSETKLAVPLVVTDKTAIKQVKAGKRELSCGYRCDVIPEVGEWNGVPYTHVQKNIIYNHVALVTRGRAGREMRIRMDGALAPTDIEDTKENLVENENLKTINLDSVDYQAEAKVIEVLQAHKAKAEESQVKLDTAITEKAKVEAEKDVLKERLDSITAELEALKANHVDADKVKALVQARVELEAFATKAGVEVKNDMDDVAIMKAIVQKVSLKEIDAVKLDNADYLKVRFDIVKEDFAELVKKAGNAQARSLNAVKNDSAGSDKVETYAEKKAKYLATIRNASKAK